jgi:NAD(P)-dependent dehydrogenase (short-subunit alcohol dehydrogenase family)
VPETTGTEAAVANDSGNVALVVGGGTGMGFAAANRLARRGVPIVLSGRREDVLVKAGARLREAHPDSSVEIFPGDAGVAENARAMVALAVERFGGLDILVGAAGIYEEVEFTDIDEEAWRRTLTATLDAMAYPAIAAARQMKDAGGGRIVLISSIDADTSEPNVAAYNVAKAGVGALVRSIVVDCTRYGIQANAVAPGWVYTPMVASYLDNADPAVMEPLNPLARAGQADEIGNVIEYLALDAPAFLTGSTILVDGGQTIRAAWPG